MRTPSLQDWALLERLRELCNELQQRHWNSYCDGPAEGKLISNLKRAATSLANRCTDVIDCANPK